MAAGAHLDPQWRLMLPGLVLMPGGRRFREVGWIRAGVVYPDHERSIPVSFCEILAGA